MGEPPRKPSDKKNEDESVLIGELFDEKYRITGKLGGGGMGLVYEAQHEWMERRVALKVLRPNFIAADDYEVFLERFKREAQTASRITHPNAVTIYDFGIFNEMPYLAMQFIEGKTINELIKENGPFEHSRACELLQQTLDAVDAAHALQIIHRDIKPDNIMVSVSPGGAESVHVLDFGIAKVLDAAESNASMTLPGKTVGTPRYMSPEQVLARTIDVRTDIYALGLVLYEMLSGDIPFKADSSMQLMFHHVNTAPLPIRDVNTTALTSKRLEQLVMKALQKDPEKRFQTVNEMKEALQAAMLTAPSKTSISIPSFATSMIPAAIAGNQKKSLFALGGILGVGLLIVGALAFQSAPDEGDKLTRTETDSSQTTRDDMSGELSTGGVTQLAALKSSSEDTPSPEVVNRSPLVEDSARSKSDEREQEAEGSLLEKSSAEKVETLAAAKMAPAEQDPVEPVPAKDQPAEGEKKSDTQSPETESPDSKAADSKVSDSVASDSKSDRQGTIPTTKLSTENPLPALNTSTVGAPEVKELEARNEETIEEEKTAPLKNETPEIKASEPPSSKTTPASKITPASKTPPAIVSDSEKAANKVASKSQATSDSPSNDSPKAELSFASTPIPVLIKHLAGEDRTARENAAIELQNRGNAPVPALIQTLDNHPSPRARFWAVFILGKIRAVESTESIERALKDESGMVSETAKKALRAVNPSRANQLLGPSPTSRPPQKESGEKPNSGFLGIF